LDNGNYTITLSLTDSSGAKVQSSAQVRVLNVAPISILANGGPVNEGSIGSVTLTGQHDPSTTDTIAGFRYSYDFNNDGTFEIDNSTSPSAVVPAAYLADGPGIRTIRGRIADKDGGYTDYTTTIQVLNVAPSVSVGTTATIGPGATLSRLASFADPGADSWTASVDFGDGSGAHPLPLNPDKTFALSHTYSSPGSFAVTVWVRDKDGAVGMGSFTVYVLPAPVTVTSVRIATVKIGTGKKAKKTTGIILQFSGALNPTQAGNAANYHLRSGTTKKGRTTYKKNVPLSAALYNASAHTVTLIPKTKLNTAQPMQLTINPALSDPYGRPIDGNHDGQPGGDFTANLTKKGATVLARPASRRAAVAAVDRAIRDMTVSAAPLRRGRK
jgi:hypothetical protein